MIFLQKKEEQELQPLDGTPLGKELGFTYIRQMRFENPNIERQVRQMCARSLKKGWVTARQKFLGFLHKKDLDDEIEPRMSIRYIDRYIGYGVFAEQNFLKHSYLGEYAGILRKRYWFKKSNDYSFIYPKGVNRESRFVLDAGQYGNYVRFINHGDHPNAEALGVYHSGVYRVIILATRPINKGDQITYDYGEHYWKHRPKIGSH